MHNAEIFEGRRFAFGKNRARFLWVLDDARIESAKESLKINLGMENLKIVAEHRSTEHEVCRIHQI